MRHQKGRKKLNLSAPHRRAFLRNNVIALIEFGQLKTTKARAKEIRKLAEKVVTLAREGNTFNVRRRVQSLLPYKSTAVDKLFTDIAPQYLNRPGGYTRIVPLGRRLSDTAEMALLAWV